MLSCHSNRLRITSKEHGHVLSLWYADKVETYQANPISLLQVQPHDRVHCHGIEALVHVVFYSCDPARGNFLIRCNLCGLTLKCSPELKEQITAKAMAAGA
jgi:hypothetical protein